MIDYECRLVMRVCLVNPPRIHPKAWGMPCANQALDLAYVAAVLEANHHSVCIIDAPGEGWRTLVSKSEVHYRVGLTDEQISAKLKQYSPDIVVINLPSSAWYKDALDVAFIVKSINRSIVTALMGLDPSSRPTDCLNCIDIDFVAIGEPEYTILELANSLEKGLPDLSTVLGIGYKSKGKVVLTEPRPLIKDLDSLPFPARHLLPMEQYFASVKVNPLRGDVSKRWATVLTSRGCVNRCVYCSNHIVFGRGWRARSAKNVVDELEMLVKTYRVKQIDFEDSNLTLNKRRMAAICDLIIERGLKFEWFTPTGVRADVLDESLLKKMHRSGCKRIMVAPESGVQRVVNEVIHKNLNLKKVEETIVSARRNGIKVGCFFILGLIGETKQDINDTIAYAYKLKRLGADRFCFNIVQPLYGTELYEQAKAGGFLKENFGDENLAGATALIETKEFSEDDLYHLVAKANLINAPSSKDLFVKAVKNPKKAIQFLLKNGIVLIKSNATSNNIDTDA